MLLFQKQERVANVVFGFKSYESFVSETKEDAASDVHARAKAAVWRNDLFQMLTVVATASIMGFGLGGFLRHNFRYRACDQNIMRQRLMDAMLWAVMFFTSQGGMFRMAPSMLFCVICVCAVYIVGMSDWTPLADGNIYNHSWCSSFAVAFYFELLIYSIVTGFVLYCSAALETRQRRDFLRRGNIYLV